MKANQYGNRVVVTMSSREARELETELLWSRDADKYSTRLYGVLNDLSEGGQQR